MTIKQFFSFLLPYSLLYFASFCLHRLFAFSPFEQDFSGLIAILTPVIIGFAIIINFKLKFNDPLKFKFLMALALGITISFITYMDLYFRLLLPEGSIMNFVVQKDTSVFSYSFGIFFLTSIGFLFSYFITFIFVMIHANFTYDN
jgi:hypothetical protein